MYFFYLKKKRGPERGPEGGPKRGPKGGSRREGPRFVYTLSFVTVLTTRSDAVEVEHLFKRPCA